MKVSAANPHYRASRGSWLLPLPPHIEQKNLYDIVGFYIGMPLQQGTGNWFSQPEPDRWARRNSASVYDVASGVAALSSNPNPFDNAAIPTLRCPSDPAQVYPGYPAGKLANYVGNMGPHCVSNCGGYDFTSTCNGSVLRTADR